MKQPATCLFPALSFVLVTLLFISKAGAEPRNFTNKEGRSITAEAVGIDVKANTVTLRTADGRTFDVPLSNLSLDDQAFLAEFKNQIAATSDPGGWKGVEINLPLSHSFVSAPGIYGAFYRTGSTRWSGEIPEGAWIHVKRVMAENAGVYIGDPELLLRFDGTWRSLSVSFREGLFYASFDGREPLLVGATCKVVPTPPPANAFPGRSYFDPTKTAELQLKFFESLFEGLAEGQRICLQPAMQLTETEVRRYRRKIESIIAHPESTHFYALLIKEFELRAFKAGREAETPEIEPSKHLEFLSLGKTPDDLRTVIIHPALTTLELSTIRTQNDLEIIGEIPSLRFVKINYSSDSDTTFQIDRLAALKNLAGIDFPMRTCKLSAASVSKCLGLRAVRFEDPDAGQSGDWMHPLKKLRNIHWSSTLGFNELKEFASKGEASNAIRFAWNFNSTPFANLPSLRALEHPGYSRNDTWSMTTPDGGQRTKTGTRPYVWPTGDIREAENLEYLAISGVSQAFIDELVTKKNPESLKVLILSDLVDCNNLGGLKVFKNLRILTISRLFESFPEDDSNHLKEIDLTELKSLEAVEILPFYDFTGIEPVVVKVGDVPFKRILDNKGPSDFISWGESESR
jgi:hypothetical protein